MMSQKVTYMHYNPVARRYVEEPEHWRYSNARDYAGVAGVLEVSMEW